MKRGREGHREAHGEEYAGPSGIARDSQWLTSEDLVDNRDLVVTIEKVLLYRSVDFEEGRSKKNAIGLQFVGKQRQLLLNATNRKMLNSMFGHVTSAWKGQQITLYVTETEAFGDTVSCVRIRNKRSRAATAAEDLLANGQDGVTLDEYKQAARTAGLTDNELDAILEEQGGDVDKAYDHLKKLHFDA